jgi:RNA polymerase sigma-70 factor (ECF subfamily)
MTEDQFKTLHARTIAALWSNVAQSYGVSEAEFVGRIYASALRTGELEGGDRGAKFLSHLRADELCLVLACERADDGAWRDFDANYRHGMLAAARALTRDEAEAEDLTQSLVGDLYGVRLDGDRRVSKFTHYAGRGSLGGWLRAVVYQVFIDRKRQTARLEQIEEVEEFERLAAKAEHPLVAPGARPDQLEDARLRRATEEALGQALLGLETRDRLLLNYYYFDELTLREIGLLMEVHEATISRWLQRAQRLARRKTEEILQRTYGLRRSEVAECLQLAARAEIDVRSLLEQTKGAPAGRVQ